MVEGGGSRGSRIEDFVVRCAVRTRTGIKNQVVATRRPDKTVTVIY